MPMTKPFTYQVSGEFDHILEEHGNTYTAFRKIMFGDSGVYKPDVRKYYATEEGERMAKGCTLTDEAANNLASALIQEGYGEDKDLYNTISEYRPELCSRFIEEVQKLSDKEIKAHLTKYPVPEDNELTEYDLDEVI